MKKLSINLNSLKVSNLTLLKQIKPKKHNKKLLSLKKHCQAIKSQIQIKNKNQKLSKLNSSKKPTSKISNQNPKFNKIKSKKLTNLQNQLLTIKQVNLRKNFKSNCNKVMMF